MSTTKKKKSQSIRNSFQIRGGVVGFAKNTPAAPTAPTAPTALTALDVVEEINSTRRIHVSKFQILSLRDTKLFLCVCHHVHPAINTAMSYITKNSDAFENPIIFVPESKSFNTWLTTPFFPYDIIPASLSVAFSEEAYSHLFDHSNFQMLMDLVHELNEQRNGRPERRSYTTPEAYRIVNGLWDSQESCAKELLTELNNIIVEFSGSDSYSMSLPDRIRLLGRKYTDVARAAHLSHLIFSTSSYKEGHRSALVHFKSIELLDDFFNHLSGMVNRVCDTGYMRPLSEHLYHLPEPEPES
jgi:hypothetical protein